MTVEPFPWARVMAALRFLPPQQFWTMTPRELAAALGGAAPPLTRGALDRLMKEFPDG